VCGCTLRHVLHGTCCNLSAGAGAELVKQQLLHKRVLIMASNPSKLVLVVNSGSSSLKFKLFDAAAGLRGEVSGLVERIGDVANSRIITTHLSDPDAQKSTVDRGVKVPAWSPLRSPVVACAPVALTCSSYDAFPTANQLCRTTPRRSTTCCST
jgi:Acetokinase family